MPDALSEAEKEKLKLRAAAYDRLSTAVVTVGVLVPGVALLTRDPALRHCRPITGWCWPLWVFPSCCTMLPGRRSDGSTDDRL
jgi:hypothetical protein